MTFKADIPVGRYYIVPNSLVVVSLDYIFGRTDKPQGKLYEGKMKIEKVYPEMDKFIEMCFDPGSPINERLRETLREMLKE